MRIFSTIFFVVMFFGTATGQGRYEYTSDATEAYDLVMSLRFNEARTKINFVKQNDPNNLIVHYIENYLDFFTCYINEDKAEFDRLEKNKDYRIKLIKEGDSTSPYHLYLQASIRLHWALARLKFSEYITSFREVNKAFKLLKQNEKKFPNFMPNKKDLGILHAMVGTIPDNYKWGVELLTSLTGTIDQGKAEIKEVLDYSDNNYFIYEHETRVLYAYLMMHLDNDGDNAWNLLRTSKFDPTENPLAAFTMANVAMRTGRNDEAIDILLKRPQGKKYHPFPYLDFMLGNAKMRRLDADSDKYFLKYLKEFKGIHFIKESYQRLSWNALINDDLSLFYKYNQKIKSEGNSVTGGDKNALLDAKVPVIHHVALLKARLLFDGGYYQKGYDILKSLSSDDFKDRRSKLEFTYRLGRILHKLKKYHSAISFYEKTIENGADEPWYFACNSALQIGLLFEELKSYDQAKAYFQKCTTISPDEHKTGLHQQAKAGLSRIKKKL